MSNPNNPIFVDPQVHGYPDTFIILSSLVSPEVGPESDAETAAGRSPLTDITPAARLGVPPIGPREVAPGVTAVDATDDAVDPTTVDRAISPAVTRALGGFVLRNTDPLA